MNAGNATVTGSLNWLETRKITRYGSYQQAHITGNIETMFKSSSKGCYYIIFGINNGQSAFRYDITGSCIVFSEMYGLELIHDYGYAVTGTVSMSGKLQKLYYWDMYTGINGITGSKSQLYNGGANVTTYSLRG